MIDLVTVLKHCQSDFQLANRLLGERYHGFVLTPIEVDEALAALSEPFDPTKTDGWLKIEPSRTDGWVLDIGRDRYILSKPVEGVWFIDRNSSFIFQGAIPTHAFFNDLCENLNIKP